MKSFDGYGWKGKSQTEAVEPGKPLIGGLWPERFNSPEKHPLLSLSEVGRTIDPPYTILAMEV